MYEEKVFSFKKSLFALILRTLRIKNQLGILGKAVQRLLGLVFSETLAYLSIHKISPPIACITRI